MNKAIIFLSALALLSCSHKASPSTLLMMRHSILPNQCWLHTPNDSTIVHFCHGRSDTIRFIDPAQTDPVSVHPALKSSDFLIAYKENTGMAEVLPPFIIKTYRDTSVANKKLKNVLVNGWQIKAKGINWLRWNNKWLPL